MCAARGELLVALRRMPGVLQVWDSEANMVLIRVTDSAKAHSAMKARGVLVKNVAALHPLLAQCLRLTVGTTADNALMLAALEASI
ncbi:Histidinol-phosphate aminotransferase 2 [compost metagenome]